MSLIAQLANTNKKDFYSKHIFHERQMNSCPIGCQGCAVSAVTNAKGAINYQDLLEFYQDAHSQGVSLQLTKVEGYDPVFVNYADYEDLPFAQSIKDAVNLGHQIITPVCTTGNWRSERTKWQLSELGKLDDRYREYQYPSGNSGVGFALSVPREIKAYANGRYDYDKHLEKIIEDIHLLTVAGQLDVLVYYNSNSDDDYDTAIKIKSNVVINLNEQARKNTNFVIANFNSETVPESCYRYSNSMLVSNSGFTAIDEKSLEWELDPNLTSQEKIASDLVASL